MHGFANMTDSTDTIAILRGCLYTIILYGCKKSRLRHEIEIKENQKQKTIYNLLMYAYVLKSVQ